MGRYSWAAQAICILSSINAALAFIPAMAANTSQGLGLDVHDNSKVTLTWNPSGTYETVVSYQQMGNESVGISKVRAQKFVTAADSRDNHGRSVGGAYSCSRVGFYQQ